MDHTVLSMDECLMHQWQSCESFAYRLHSRFSHAINWMNAEGEMVTFLSEDLPNGPNTLIVDIESFDDWDLNESVMFAKSSQGLSLSNTNINLMIQEDVQIWRTKLPKLSKVNGDAILAIHLFLSLNNGDLQEIESCTENDSYHKLPVDDNCKVNSFQCFHNVSFCFCYLTT